VINQYFATCPKGLEGLLLEELKNLGAAETRETVAGVYFSGDIAFAYRVCLWSRLANKVLLPLKSFAFSNQDDLYEGARTISWQEHLRSSGSLLVDFVGTNDAIRNTQFGAVKIKDAIVDSLRDASGERPSVAKQDPDLRINAHLAKDKIIVSIDLSGESLHRRGYRLKQGLAPMKENLASAVLLRAGWSEIAAQGGALLDPMCGAGTFLIEGAMMAADIAPGLMRAGFGFERWLNHDNKIWMNLRDEAQERRRIGLAKPLPEIRGYDADLHTIRAAEENIMAAELDDWLRVSRKELAEFKVPTHKAINPGLVICNPPYGERLGEVESLKLLYAHLGERLRNECEGWRAGIFTGNPDLGKQMGLRANKKYNFFNGTIPSELLLFAIDSTAFVKSRVEQDERFDKDEEVRAKAEEKVAQSQRQEQEAALTPGAKMLVNRLQKNMKEREKWAKKNNISCYRLYDADMPEYSAAIDIYSGYTQAGAALKTYAHVQEYAAPKTVDEERAAARFVEIEMAVPYALNIPAANISYKQRRRQKGSSQYEKFSETLQGDTFFVEEGSTKLHINLWQYLDTGLFLDHRPVRLKITELAKGKRFLNLFCYTATATIHAALAGARYTTSVDMSKTYLDWARKNLALNGLSEAKNRLEQTDCKTWLETNDELFDLILLDPPSFSNSKRMEDDLDVQRDHVELIHGAMRALAQDGALFFSTNLRSFKMGADALSMYTLEDITQKTIDEDFKRDAKIHQCWLVKH
jgi:23S rRNA (guanine2445-N2)-methyltransferase / 23S rRNA (guanine2069-N7)-methyltransferase